jgi:hypothetical protein
MVGTSTSYFLANDAFAADTFTPTNTARAVAPSAEMYPVRELYFETRPVSPEPVWSTLGTTVWGGQ